MKIIILNIENKDIIKLSEKTNLSLLYMGPLGGEYLKIFFGSYFRMFELLWARIFQNIQIFRYFSQFSGVFLVKR